MPSHSTQLPQVDYALYDTPTQLPRKQYTHLNTDAKTIHSNPHFKSKKFSQPFGENVRDNTGVAQKPFSDKRASRKYNQFALKEYGQVSIN